MILARCLLGLAASLSLDRASAWGGFLGRNVFYHFPVSRNARANLIYVYPEMTQEKRDHILRNMWDNLGRIAFEYPHLNKIARERILFVDDNCVTTEQSIGDGAAFFLSGHLSNFEALFACGRMMFEAVGFERAINNEILRKTLDRLRSRGAQGAGETIAKKSHSSLDMRRLIRQKRNIGVLVDQKVRRGEVLDFLRRPTETSLVPAKLATKYRIPIYVATMHRTGGANFVLRFHGPFLANQDIESDKAAQELAQKTNDILSAHINAHPSEWLWLHRRWGNEPKNQLMQQKKSKMPSKTN